MTPMALIGAHWNTLKSLKIDHARLDSDFEDLDIPSVVEYDRALRAIAAGMPLTRAQWSLPVPWKDSLNNYERLPLAHVHARTKKLPDDFSAWSIPELAKSGRTVAHISAMYRPLPEDFTDWTLESANGHTVAHIAAAYGTLHESFDQWTLVMSCGRTVAHEAALHGVQRFPANFSLWHLEERDLEGRGQPGTRVIDYVRMANNQEAVAQYEAWCMQEALSEKQPRAIIRRSSL